ncbi:hypothetical protein Tcan_11558 [Toxocara canis]|uniref:Uncharacterized protein n=1 Tax=Toxocara canis TaxID=6265 RepID=A0A0B2W437_TOXCA|nr:hypothetical protein Tcan_11558 [Toxocara canis]
MWINSEVKKRYCSAQILIAFVFLVDDVQSFHLHNGRAQTVRWNRQEFPEYLEEEPCPDDEPFTVGSYQVQPFHGQSSAGEQGPPIGSYSRIAPLTGARAQSSELPSSFGQSSASTASQVALPSLLRLIGSGFGFGQQLDFNLAFKLRSAFNFSNIVGRGR